MLEDFLTNLLGMSYLHRVERMVDILAVLGKSSPRSLMFMLLVTSFVATLYVSGTTLIVRVPREFPFGILKVLPPSYWVAVGLAIALLLVSIYTGASTYLWFSAAILTVLVPGLADLTNPYPRDVISTTLAAQISQHGTFSAADNVFLNFPASAVLFSSQATVTGLAPILVVRSFGLVYNLLLLALGFAFFHRLGMKETPSLLAALVAVFSFYLQGVFVYTSLIAFVFYILVLLVVLAPYSKAVPKTLLLVILFLAMLACHPFTPFATFGAVAAVLLGWRTANRILRRLRPAIIEGNHPPTRRSVLLPVLVLFLVYWSYVAVVPFTWGLLTVRHTTPLASLLEAFSPLVSARSTYSVLFSRIVGLYAPLLFVPFAIYLFTIRDGRKIQLVLWILGTLLSLFVATAGGAMSYAEEFLARIFALAILPLTYGIAALFQSKGRFLRALAIAVLLVAIGLHIPAHYGQDSFLVIQGSTNQGVQFFAQHSPSNASIDSPLTELQERNYLDPYYIDEYRTGNTARPNPGSYFLSNYQAESGVLYRKGLQTFERLNQDLESAHYELVFSNGDFRVYAQGES